MEKNISTFNSPLEWEIQVQKDFHHFSRIFISSFSYKLLREQSNIPIQVFTEFSLKKNSRLSDIALLIQLDPNK